MRRTLDPVLRSCNSNRGRFQYAVRHLRSRVSKTQLGWRSTNTACHFWGRSSALERSLRKREAEGGNPSDSTISRVMFPTADCKPAVTKQVGEDDEKSVTSITHHFSGVSPK